MNMKNDGDNKKICVKKQTYIWKHWKIYCTIRVSLDLFLFLTQNFLQQKLVSLFQNEKHEKRFEYFQLCYNLPIFITTDPSLQF